MQTYIAFLRGINVSGQKRILMTELKLLFDRLNFKNNRTYIQSGNVVFQSNEVDGHFLENSIKEQILKQFGFEVPVLVKTPIELKSIFDRCSFQMDKKENSYFILLYEKPAEALVQELSKLKFPGEEFQITENCVYYFCSIGFGRAKCNNNFFERKLKIVATGRNYRTMKRLIEMAS